MDDATRTKIYRANHLRDAQQPTTHPECKTCRIPCTMCPRDNMLPVEALEEVSDLLSELRCSLCLHGFRELSDFVPQPFYSLSIIEERLHILFDLEVLCFDEKELIRKIFVAEHGIKEEDD